VLEHSQQKQNLINSLRGFDDAEIFYFGGAKKIHLLLNYLAG
jgi:hypothetical protein